MERTNILCGDRFGMFGEYKGRVMAVVFTVISIRGKCITLSKREIIDIGFGEVHGCGPQLSGLNQTHQITIVTSSKTVCINNTKPPDIRWVFGLERIHALPDELIKPDLQQMTILPQKRFACKRLQHYPESWEALLCICQQLQKHPLFDINVIQHYLPHLIQFDYLRLFTKVTSDENK